MEGHLTWQKALSRAEMAGNKNRPNDQEDDRNTANYSSRRRVARKLRAESIPAPVLAHYRRGVNCGYRKRDQEYERASVIDQSSTQIDCRGVCEPNNRKNLEYDDNCCCFPIR